MYQVISTDPTTNVETVVSRHRSEPAAMQAAYSFARQIQKQWTWSFCWWRKNHMRGSNNARRLVLGQKILR